MALDGQDERSTSTQREIDLQNQPDALQSQVTELHKAQDATPENPELFSEVQSLKEKLGKHSELLAQSAEKALSSKRRISFSKKKIKPSMQNEISDDGSELKFGPCNL